MSKLVWFWRWERRTIRAAIQMSLNSNTLIVSLRDAAVFASEGKRHPLKLLRLSQKMETMGFGANVAGEHQSSPDALEFELDKDLRSSVPRAFTKKLTLDSSI